MLRVYHARTIQVTELSKLLADLGLGEGDVDLDEALAEMEIENMDDNMDSTLNKTEFFRWFLAKKSELKGSGSTAESSREAAPAHHEAVHDLNAWGDDPKHHAAAVKIQAVARGRLDRKKVTVEDGEIEEINPGNGDEEMQGVVRRYGWCHTFRFLPQVLSCSAPAHCPPGKRSVAKTQFTPHGGFCGCFGCAALLLFASCVRTPGPLPSPADEEC